jgi:twinkle protein
MGKIISRNNPCLSAECGSHDARQIYEDGTSFCFSCKKFFPKDPEMTIEYKQEEKEKKESYKEEYETLAYTELKDRRIDKKVCEFFGVKVEFDESGTISKHIYKYTDDSYKVRQLPKKFYWKGTAAPTGLFGMNLFNPGRRLIITEGEIDALSVAQASFDKYNKIYPVVSIPSAAQTKALLENREWIRSFDEVVLFLDNDKAGTEATEEAIKIIGVDKVKLVKSQEKDANDVLKKQGSQKVLQLIFDAAKYVPSGIVSKEQLWEALVVYNSIPSVPYPPCLEGINTKLKGKRSGEITLFISGTGAGKSTMLREDMIHTLSIIPKEDKIGIISLEESPPETARKVAGMIINKNPADNEIPLEELKVGFDTFFGEDRVILLDHSNIAINDKLIEKLEYMCLSGCKYIYIDHITILVSEGADGLVGNEAIDKVMNDLLRLVKKYPVWIGLVSHLRKTPNTQRAFEEGKLPTLDDIRGSGSIKQISFDVIAFSRNMTAEEEEERNQIKIRVLKARHTGLTGDVTGAIYDHETGRLRIGDSFVKEKVEL